MEDAKKQTIRYYDEFAEEWTKEHSERAFFWREELERFNSLLPVGRILEIGSGSGHDAQLLIEMGYDYVGTDASEGFLRIARRRNPEATFIKKSVSELDESLGKFDGFWCVATLLHIPKSEIDSALSSIKARVRSGGIGFITMKKGEGEEEETKTGRLFAYYGEDEFKNVLKRNSFSIIESTIKEGEKFSWLTLFVKC